MMTMPEQLQSLIDAFSSLPTISAAAICILATAGVLYACTRNVELLIVMFTVLVYGGLPLVHHL